MTDIIKYLKKTDEAFNSLQEDSQKIAVKVGEEPKNPLWQSELSRINKQMVLLGGEQAYFEEIQDLLTEIENNNELAEEAKEEEPEMVVSLEKESLACVKRLESLEEELIDFLVKEEEEEDKVTMEIKAAAGGQESALFAEDILNMYQGYFEDLGFRATTSHYLTEIIYGAKGCKHAKLEVAGLNVNSVMKFESGVHKVQRVPLTEKQGRVHSSTCQVIIYKQSSFKEVELDPRDLKIEVMRASGAGGQHVNKTESAVRITHLPTGLQVYNADERDQHANKAKALAVLTRRLNSQRKEAHFSQISEARSEQMGTGNLNERIRTYNWPDGRVTGACLTRSPPQSYFVQY